MTSISDDAVLAATGRKWDAWFSILDRAGAGKMSHKDIVAVLANESGVGPWWRQIVTVEYERARGLRVKHQTARGFNIGASKTIAAPLSAVYKAWATPAARRRWLDASDVVVRSAVANKVIRLTWSDGTMVEVRFTAKGDDRSQVVVDHGKLGSAAAATRMKTFWKKQLAALAGLLED